MRNRNRRCLGTFLARVVLSDRQMRLMSALTRMTYIALPLRDSGPKPKVEQFIQAYGDDNVHSTAFHPATIWHRALPGASPPPME